MATSPRIGRQAAGRLRADAASNRARLVHAARAVFAERGADAPLEEVASRAGVGIATLYRRFPTRADLLTAALEDKMTVYADAVEAALAEEDPWVGFTTYVRQMCAMQAADAGFADVLAMTFPTGSAFADLRRRAYVGFRELVGRAKEAGALRADFSTEDLVVLLMANAGVVNATKDTEPDAWERFAAYMLDAFSAPAASALPPPPDRRRLYRAMQGAARRG